MKRVEVRDLEFGMFVNRLDRSWLESPFLLKPLLLLIRDAEGRELSPHQLVDLALIEKKPARHGQLNGSLIRKNTAST